MSNLTTLQPAGASNLPAAFQGQKAAAVFQGQEIESGADGLEGSYGVIKYAGKVWALHIRGETRPFLRPDDNSPRGSIDVIFVRSAPHKAKTYYEKFVEGSKEKPLCWSNDGAVPDAAVPVKQAAACSVCPKNVFGSRITDDGKQAKQCGDHKRAAVVLDPALAQSVLGAPLSEPVLLRIPAASLNDFAVFSQTMENQGFKLPSFVARISFDITKNFPKLKFEAIRPLNEEEGKISLALRDDPQAMRIIADQSGETGPTAVTGNGNSTPAPTATTAQNATAPLVTTQLVNPHSGLPTQTGQNNVVPMNVAPRPEALQQQQVPQQMINITPPPAPAPQPTPQQQAAAMQPIVDVDTGVAGTTALDADIDAKINALLS